MNSIFHKYKNRILYSLCDLCVHLTLRSLWFLHFLRVLCVVFPLRPQPVRLASPRFPKFSRMPGNLQKYICFMLLFIPTIIFSQPAFQQPKQMLSKVKYDTNIKDTFFEKQYFSYEWFMIQEDDGTFSSAIYDSLGNEIIDTTKNIHTANCITQHQGEHTIRYCNAFYKGDTLMLFINDFTASTYDNLLVKVFNGKFSCQYWTAYPSMQRSQKLTWVTTSQRLTLNSEKYKVDDEVKGKIYVMIKEEQLTHEGLKETTKIMIEGVVKTRVVEGE